MTSNGRAGTAIAVVLALSVIAVLALRRDRGAPEDSSGAEPVGPGRTAPVGPVDETELAEAGLELPPLDPQTKAEMREVVEFASEAGRDRLAGLERMLEAEQPLVVGNAIQALGRLGLFTAGSKYARFLGDGRERVRSESVRALGASGDPEAVPLLAGVLASEDGNLRRLALQSLGQIGGAPALAELERYEPRDATERVFLDEARAAASESRRTSLGGMSR